MDRTELAPGAEYGDAVQVRANFGIDRGHLYYLLRENLIRSINIRRRGMQRGKRLYDLETAFEEASHAVIREYFGDKIVEVAITENSGHCDFRRRIDGDKDIVLLGNIAGMRIHDLAGRFTGTEKDFLVVKLIR